MPQSVIKIRSNKHPQGWLLLSEADFNPDVHEKYVEGQAPSEASSGHQDELTDDERAALGSELGP